MSGFTRCCRELVGGYFERFTGSGSRRTSKFPSNNENVVVYWGSAQRLRRHRELYRNHVWSYASLIDRTEDGRQRKLLVVIDEFTRECLAAEVGRTFTARDVMLTLQYLFALRGVRYTSAATMVRSSWPKSCSAGWTVQPLARSTSRSQSLGKRYVESFNGKLRDELLNRELFLSIPEARYVIDEWRRTIIIADHTVACWQTPAAYAATLPDRLAGVFPAAPRVESPLGTRPSLRRNTRTNHSPILSQPLVLKSGALLSRDTTVRQEWRKGLSIARKCSDRSMCGYHRRTHGNPYLLIRLPDITFVGALRASGLTG